MALTWNKPEGREWVGYTFMFFVFILAIYIGVKHYKQPGFWFGILVMILLGIRISTGINPSFKSAILSVEPSPNQA